MDEWSGENRQIFFVTKASKIGWKVYFIWQWWGLLWSTDQNVGQLIGRTVMNIADMRMSRWMSEVIREDKIKNMYLYKSWYRSDFKNKNKIERIDWGGSDIF